MAFELIEPNICVCTTRYVKPSTLRKVPSLAFFTSSSPSASSSSPNSQDRDFLMGVTSSYDDAKRGGRALFYA